MQFKLALPLATHLGLATAAAGGVLAALHGNAFHREEIRPVHNDGAGLNAQQRVAIAAAQTGAPPPLRWARLTAVCSAVHCRCSARRARHPTALPGARHFPVPRSQGTTCCALRHRCGCSRAMHYRTT